MLSLPQPSSSASTKSTRTPPEKVGALQDNAGNEYAHTHQKPPWCENYNGPKITKEQLDQLASENDIYYNKNWRTHYWRNSSEPVPCMHLLCMFFANGKCKE